MYKSVRKSLVAFSQGRSKSTKAITTLDYCCNLVRKHDYENYLCTLLLPSSQQEAAFAIRAFNIEVANVADQVTDRRLGDVRLKFWEEVVESIFQNKPHKHPVALELHRVLQKQTLSKKNLIRLITAREGLLTANGFPSLENMEKYAEESTSPIYYLLLNTSGIEDVNADHAVSHLGKSQGLTNLVRSIPYHSQRKMVCLPQDQLTKNKVSHETIFRGGCTKEVRDVVFAVASQASNHLQKTRKLKKNVSKTVHKLWLTTIPLENYLERLRLVDFDVFHPKLQTRDSNLPLQLLWKKWTRQF